MANKRQKQDQLAQSDRFIAAVKQSINKQLDLIDELKRAGGDVAKDEELLDTLIPMLRAMLDHRRAILMQDHWTRQGTNRPPKSRQRRRSPPRSSSG